MYNVQNVSLFHNCQTNALKGSNPSFYSDLKWQKPMTIWSKTIKPKLKSLHFQNVLGSFLLLLTFWTLSDTIHIQDWQKKIKFTCNCCQEISQQAPFSKPHTYSFLLKVNLKLRVYIFLYSHSWKEYIHFVFPTNIHTFLYKFL